VVKIHRQVKMLLVCESLPMFVKVKMTFEMDGEVGYGEWHKQHYMHTGQKITIKDLLSKNNKYHHFIHLYH